MVKKQFGLQATIGFDDILEDSQISENMNLQYQIEVEKQEIKIINERKISINLTLKISYELYGTDTIDIFNDFSEIEDVQVNSKKLKINSLVGIGNSLASLKEEMKVESTDIVSDILKFDTNVLNKEVKISHNKVLTKADLMVSITYLTQDQRICDIEEKYPLMSFVEIDNVKENNTCSTEYQVRNVLLNINNSEENSITVQMEYEITCKAFEDKEEEIVSDLYSLKYDLEFSSAKLEINDELGEGRLKNYKYCTKCRKERNDTK